MPISVYESKDLLQLSYANTTNAAFLSHNPRIENLPQNISNNCQNQLLPLATHMAIIAISLLFAIVMIAITPLFAAAVDSYQTLLPRHTSTFSAHPLNCAFFDHLPVA